MTRAARASAEIGGGVMRTSLFRTVRCDRLFKLSFDEFMSSSENTILFFSILKTSDILGFPVNDKRGHAGIVSRT